MMSKLSRRMIVVAALSMVIGVCLTATSAQAIVGHFEGFENDSGDWNNGTRVEGGTDGIINSSGGSHHLQITDSSSYSFLGGSSSTWGGGWSSSLDIYVDVTDSHIQSGEYGFDLTQSIISDTGDSLQDNLFHVGAVADGNGGYVIGVNSGHNTGTTPSYCVVNPHNYHNETYGTFSQSGWYTFEWEFAPAAEPDGVSVTWTIHDDQDNVFWTASEVTEDYTESVAGGNNYMWFPTIVGDEINIDNAAVVPEPATMSLLALGGVALIRRKRS